jgi:hypothetical protein
LRLMVRNKFEGTPNVEIRPIQVKDFI